MNDCHTKLYFVDLKISFKFTFDLFALDIQKMSFMIHFSIKQNPIHFYRLFTKQNKKIGFLQIVRQNVVR